MVDLINWGQISWGWRHINCCFEAGLQVLNNFKNINHFFQIGSQARCAKWQGHHVLEGLVKGRRTLQLCYPLLSSISSNPIRPEMEEDGISTSYAPLK
jgi:hypothetical protein